MIIFLLVRFINFIEIVRLLKKRLVLKETNIENISSTRLWHDLKAESETTVS
jgi:hypothetical protein